MAGSNEITIAISSTEEDIRKLYDTSKARSIQILNRLLQKDPNLLKKLSMISTSSNNESPLHVSVSHGHLEFTRVLLDHSPELVVEVDAFQRMPLHLAATNGYLEIVKALLERNTSACLVRDQDGLIPLHYAVINKHIEVVQELINARPQSVWMKLKSGQTILHLCVEGNHLEGMKLLTEIVANHHKDFLNTIDEAGNTILDLSFKLKQVEMVGYLVSIAEVKTGTTITNSIGRKGSVGLKKKMSKRSSPTKKKRGYWKIFQDKLKYKGDWAKEVQGIMMLVATVIAAVTFQAGINPPGGVWQQDTPYNSTNHINQQDPSKNERVFKAGTAIMSYDDDDFLYFNYLLANTVSFMASVSVIMLIISRFPLKNKVCSSLLGLAMFWAVFFLAFGYICGVGMLNPYLLSQEYTPASIADYVLLGVVFLIGLWYLVRFLVWVAKSLWRISSFMLKSKCFNITVPSTT